MHLHEFRFEHLPVGGVGPSSNFCVLADTSNEACTGADIKIDSFKADEVQPKKRPCEVRRFCAGDRWRRILYIKNIPVLSTMSGLILDAVLLMWLDVRCADDAKTR